MLNGQGNTNMSFMSYRPYYDIKMNINKFNPMNKVTLNKYGDPTKK